MKAIPTSFALGDILHLHNADRFAIVVINELLIAPQAVLSWRDWVAGAICFRTNVAIFANCLGCELLTEADRVPPLPLTAW